MDTDEIKFTCENCGREFEPNPESFVETGFNAELQKTAEVEEIEGYTEEELRAMTPFALSQLGLDEESLEKLLQGEEVTTGAACICPECQEKIFADAAEEAGE